MAGGPERRRQPDKDPGCKGYEQGEEKHSTVNACISQPWNVGRGHGNHATKADIGQPQAQETARYRQEQAFGKLA